MTRAIFIATLALACAACNELEQTKLVGPPIAAGARGMIIVALQNGVAREAWAFDLSRSDPRLWSLPSDGDLQLFAIMIDCPLGALELREGPLAIDVKGRALPSGVVLASDFTDGVQSAWAAVDPPAGLTDLRISGTEPDPCAVFTPVFDVTNIVLEGTKHNNPSFAVPLDAHSVLVATFDGQFFRIGDDASVVRPTELSTSTPHVGAFARADGELWLFGLRGGVIHGRLETGFVAAPSLNTTSGFERVAVDGAKDGPIELFAFTNNGVLEHFDGVAWTVIDQNQGNADLFKLDVLWIEPMRAIAVVGGPSRIVRVEPSGTRIDTLPGSEGPVALALTPIGVVIGGDQGSILLDAPGGPRVISGSQIHDRVTSFATYGPGFFASGARGVGALYHPRAGFCRFDDYARADVHPTLPLADGLLLVSRSRTLNDEVILSYLRPAAPPACEVAQ